MFSKIKKCLMFNILALYGYVLWFWWIFIFPMVGFEASKENPFVVIDAFGKQYFVVFVILVLLGLELLIRQLGKNSDSGLNIKLPNAIFNIGIVLLSLLSLFCAWMFFSMGMEWVSGNPW